MVKIQTYEENEICINPKYLKKKPNDKRCKNFFQFIRNIRLHLNGTKMHLN